MLPQSSNLEEALGGLESHEHLCLIYETPKEWRTAIIPFLTIGLKRGEKCLYVVDTHTANQVRSYLHQEGVDVPTVEASGQLVILPATEAYTREGSFDPDRMITLLIAETEKALAEGYPALRASGEMSWALHSYPGSEKLLEYESKLNRDFLSSYPCVTLCLYDRRKFNPEITKGVIMTHPLLVQGNHIYRNSYYLPTEEFLSPKWAEHEIDLLLKAIAELETLETQSSQAEELSRELFYSSPSGLYLIQDGKFQLISPEFQKVMGYSRDELLGMDSLGLVLPEDRNMVRENVVKMLKEERLSPHEYRIVTKGGEVRWVVETVTSTHYQGRRATLGNFIDITERKQAEEEVKQSWEKLRGTLNDTVNALASIAEKRDPYTAGHQRRV
ncbi:MAG TPA: MEDS domain-containing protein, partial [Dehalococcoidia bacterium]|nr:MEDS domain-containing protein [Dehalococcoidia bacterium]